MKIIYFMLFLFSVFISIDTNAHNGVTDKTGCHYCRTNCSELGVAQDKLHCHPSRSAHIRNRLEPLNAYTRNSIEKSNLIASSTISLSPFGKAKQLLYKHIYKGHELTFYCNCKFKKRQVDLTSCNVTPRKNSKRTNLIETEHVMPVHEFGMFRTCWQYPLKICGKSGGRACCLEKNKVFKKAHNDLHNLFPSVGDINGDRSNYKWGMISGERRSYGSCDIEVDSSIRRAEPPESVRGNIARVYFYMSATYGVRLSKSQRQLFEAWDKLDPVDDWEIERNKRIKKIQGNSNQFIGK